MAENQNFSLQELQDFLGNPSEELWDRYLESKNDSRCFTQREARLLPLEYKLRIVELDATWDKSAVIMHLLFMDEYYENFYFGRVTSILYAEEERYGPVIEELRDAVLWGRADSLYSERNVSGTGYTRLYNLRTSNEICAPIYERWYLAGAVIEQRAKKRCHRNSDSLRSLVKWMSKRVSSEEFAQWFVRELGHAKSLAGLLSRSFPQVQQMLAAMEVKREQDRTELYAARDRIARDREVRERLQKIQDDVKRFKKAHRGFDPERDWELCGEADVHNLCIDLPSILLDESVMMDGGLKQNWTILVEKLRRGQQLLAQNRERQEAEAEVQRKLHGFWKERIEKRCRQIVTVFNGVFDLEIDPNSVLSGEVEGSYASICSSGSGMSMTQELRLGLELRQEIHQMLEAGTWLEIEEGSDEAEWAKAYEAENCLIWHELAHLADGLTLRKLLARLPQYRTLPDEAAAQARELVIDAVGFSLGEELYVHSDQRCHVASREKRRQALLESLGVQTQRILERCRDEELEPELRYLLLRLYVQLAANLKQTERAASMLPALAERLALVPGVKSDVQRAYEAVYSKARDLDVFRLQFHPTVQRLTEDREESENEESADFANVG